jgi:acetoin utilization deacetylase AcuC-like enzyme
VALRLYYTDHLDFPLPPGHRFPLSKYRKLRARLDNEPGLEFAPAPEATPEAVENAHDPIYVRDFAAGSLPEPAMRRIGFPWSPELVRRTFASVGGTVAAGRQALEHRIAGCLAGGTHHAFRDEGSGYCVFNDIAVAILTLRSEGLIRRAAVIDLDVHQGDGTAKIFEGDSAVLTLSVHGRNNFPFRKQRSVIDIEFEDGTGDQAYANALAPVLPRVMAFAPDLVIYQAGVDGLAGDRLGRLALTAAGLQARDRLVFEACRSAAVPCTITLGGGYCEPVEPTVEAHASTFLLARDLYSK